MLFTGTPCQIAGLYAFLGKPYDNLITLDVICHGVPSQKVLKQYIKELETKRNKKIINFMRHKGNGYCPPKYLIEYGDGTNEINYSSAYRTGFLKNLFQRNSCYTCDYASIPRVSDFSCGDLFFDKEILNRLDKNNVGVSLITVNSPSGQKIINDLSKDTLYLEKFLWETAIEKCEHLAHAPKMNNNRQKFFNTYKKTGFEKAAAECLGITFRKKVFARLSYELKRLIRNK